MVLADEPAAFPGECLVPALVGQGPSVPRPMGWQPDSQCWVDLLKASVALPQGEVGSSWRSLVLGGQVEAALLVTVHQRG